MRLAVALAFLLFAAALAGPAVQFEITDARGKRASSVTLEAATPDSDGWFQIKVAKAKGDPVLVWPFDGAAKVPDGPEPIHAIVIQRGEEKALASPHVIAAMATPIVLGVASVEKISGDTGTNAQSLSKAVTGLVFSTDPFEKGVGLLYSNRPADAVEQLALALKQRQRQLTRVPSEIYPLALLYGRALYLENKFDAAAVAFLTALKQRPSDALVQNFRSDALVKAGKPDAAGR